MGSVLYPIILLEKINKRWNELRRLCCDIAHRSRDFFSGGYDGNFVKVFGQRWVLRQDNVIEHTDSSILHNCIKPNGIGRCGKGNFCVFQEMGIRCEVTFIALGWGEYDNGIFANCVQGLLPFLYERWCMAGTKTHIAAQ